MVAVVVTENVAILGSTGSVGVSTLEVIRRHPDRFRVAALAANTNSTDMLAQCREFKPDRVVMVDPDAAHSLRQQVMEAGLSINIESGAERLDDLSDSGIDTVVCAIVGAVGLASTVSAVARGCKVLIANKEPLVMLGPMIMQLAQDSGAVILPLDSEHNAIFQCLPENWQRGLGSADSQKRFGVRRLLLTGSGGPFRSRDAASFSSVTPDQACAHPNWNMGRKISVDSATMMNKGLELIEACALFAIDESQVEVVIHPQSVVHSMVEYVDGSVIAEMANPDMKVPIANALGWPHRIESGVASLDLFSVRQFDFESPDYAKFPALELARNAVKAGGNAPAILNAANEVAVAAFLDQQIGFDRITDIVADTLAESDLEQQVTLQSAMASDLSARKIAEKRVRRLQAA